MLSQVYVLDTDTKQQISKEAPSSLGNFYILVHGKLSSGELESIKITVKQPHRDPIDFETSPSSVNSYFISGIRGSDLQETINNIVSEISDSDAYLSNNNIDVEGDSSEKLFAGVLGGLVHQIAYLYLAYHSPIGEGKGESFCDNGRLEVLPPQINSESLLLEGLTRQSWQYIRLLTYVYSSLFVAVPAVLVVSAMSFMNTFVDFFVEKKTITNVDVNDAIPVAIRVIYCGVLLMTRTQVSELMDSRDEILAQISQRLRHAIARIENHGDETVQEVRKSLSNTVQAIAKESTKDHEQIRKEVEQVNAEIDRAQELCTQLKEVLKLV